MTRMRTVLGGRLRAVLLCAAAFRVAGLAVSAQEGESVLLYDFEDAVSFRKVWSPEYTVAEQSTDWATSGRASLRLDVTAHDSAIHGLYYYPGVTLNLPRQRDWSEYDYLTLDVRSLQDNTPFGILVQRSGNRQDRSSRAFALAAGEYRLWLSIPKLLASGERERMKNIASFEFHLTRVPHDAVVYVDNIRLRRGDVELGEGRLEETTRSILTELHEESLAAVTVGQPTDYMDRMDSPALRVEVINSLIGALRLKKSTQETASFVEQGYAENGYAVLVADAQERVRISGQGIPSRWRTEASLDLMRGERRSFQLLLIPRPGTELRNVSVTLPDLVAEGGERLAGSQLQLEVVGYVHLPGSAHMRRHGAPSGWYADPILQWPGRVDVVAPREIQPLLVTVAVPRSCAPGVYRGEIHVKPEVARAFELPLSVRVRSVQAPHGARMPHLLGIGEKQNPETGGTDRDPQFFLSFRMNPHYQGLGNIYDRRRDGTPLDLDELKRYVDAGMNRFNLFEAMHRHVEAAYEKGEEGVQRYLDRIFRMYTDEYMEALVVAGLADKAVFYGFDEYPLVGDVHEPQRRKLARIFGALRERYGKYGVRIATTASNYGISFEALDLPVDIWIPHLRREGALARAVRADKGADVWWYTIPWEVFAAPVYSRAKPWATFGQGLGGWLYYNLNGAWQPEGQTLGEDPLTEWQVVTTGTYGYHGTGSLVYHDARYRMRPSLRLVNFREGMYDYDILAMLADEVARLDGRRESLSFAQRADLERARHIAVGRHWDAAAQLAIGCGAGGMGPDWMRREKAAELAGDVLNDMRAQSLALLETLQSVE